SIVRYKGRRLCLACVVRLVPSCDPLHGGDGVVRTEAEREELAAFWDWYWESHRTRRPRYSPPRKPLEGPKRTADEYYPVCDCGRPRTTAVACGWYVPHGRIDLRHPPDAARAGLLTRSTVYRCAVNTPPSTGC